MEELKEEYYLNRQKHILKVVCSRFVQVASIGLISLSGSQYVGLVSQASTLACMGWGRV